MVAPMFVNIVDVIRKIPDFHWVRALCKVHASCTASCSVDDVVNHTVKH